MKDRAVSITAQEVQLALGHDSNRIISITDANGRDSKMENFEKQEALVDQISSAAAHKIEIDRSSSQTNDIANLLLKVLLPPLERLKRVQLSKTTDDDLELEIAHQMKFAADREAKFVGRAELIELISWQIHSNESKNIFLFSGPSGSGKSSLLAKLAVTLCEKYRYISLVRFCGTTKMTSQKDHLLKSFVRQIEEIMKTRLINKSRGHFDMTLKAFCHFFFIFCQLSPLSGSAQFCRTV